MHPARDVGPGRPEIGSWHTLNVRIVPLVGVVAAISLGFLSACGTSDSTDKADNKAEASRPDRSSAEDLILDTAKLMLKEPDFEAACENIAEHRRPSTCAEDVRTMVQDHMMDEGMPFDKGDIASPQEGMSECLLKYGDGSMPLFGAVTVTFTEDGWVIDSIDNMVGFEGNRASPAEYECPAA